MDEKKVESQMRDRQSERKSSPISAKDVDSDDEATGKTQALMNCIYTGMFLMIGAIFVW